MILHENHLPADDSHELFFLKSGKNFNCRLLQIIGGALRVSVHILSPVNDFSIFSSGGYFVLWSKTI